jgi:oligopeptide/dipeptide ABC transporter ATP-binding protein
MATIPGSVPDPAERPPGCRFAPRCPFAIPACSAEFPGWYSIDGGLVEEGWHARCIRLDDVRREDAHIPAMKLGERA